MPIIAAALMVAALFGGGVSMAASGSLPGDALYGVKVHVNENMRSAFALSDKARAEADMADAEARMEEAAKLSANGKLDTKTESELMANFDAHVRAVSEGIAHMQANGNTADAAELTAKFKTAMSTGISTNSNAKTDEGGTTAAGSNTASGNANSSFMTHVQSQLSNFESMMGSSVDANVSNDTNTNVNGSASGSSQGSTSGSDTNGSTQIDGSINVNANL